MIQSEPCFHTSNSHTKFWN